MMLSRQLAKKYHVSSEGLAPRLEGLSSEYLLELGEHFLECGSFEDIQRWIRQKKTGIFGWIDACYFICRCSVKFVRSCQNPDPDSGHVI